MDFLSRQTSTYFYRKQIRKIQGVPQSQAAANPWHQEEEKKDKNELQG